LIGSGIGVISARVRGLGGSDENPQLCEHRPGNQAAPRLEAAWPNLSDITNPAIPLRVEPVDVTLFVGIWVSPKDARCETYLGRMQVQAPGSMALGI
jgi:hypothetical protein